MSLLCVASASNNALRSFSSSSSKQRNLKDKLPPVCTGEQDSCTCKSFQANLKADKFQAANKTAWDKYQALSSYKKVLETEDTEKKCGKNENEETDCTLNFPKFPEDADYKKACKDIGGYLCTGVIIHERCTKYLHGGEDCERTTNEQWVFPGDSMCWHRECKDYASALQTWHQANRNIMDKTKELSRVYTKSLTCPFKQSEAERRNLLIGIIAGSLFLIISMTLFGMWRKNYVKVHTHITTQAEINEADRIEAASNGGVEMNGIVPDADASSAKKEKKHKHHHKSHKKDKEKVHKHHHKTKK